jgi:hypothetical protein
MRQKVIISLLTLILSVSVYGEVVNMANKYCNLNGANKISDEYNKINNGFDAVQLDVESLDAKSDAIDSRVDAIITTPAEGVTAQEIIDARKGEATLRNKIDGIDAQMADYAAQLASRTHRDIFPSIIDMHYDILRGVGWVATEAGGTITKNVAGAAAKCDFSVTLNSVTNLVAGQLVVICADGEYYTNVIDAIAGGVVSLKYPLEKALTTADTLHNFYNNSTHPNLYGYRAIADGAIRSLLKTRGSKLLYRILPSDYSFSGSGTATDGGFVQDYTEPFAVFDTKVMTETKQAVKRIVLDNDCFLKIRTYVKTVDGAVINVQISDTANTIAYFIKNYSNLAKGATKVIEATTYLRKGSYNFKIRNLTAGKSFALGKTEIFEISQKYDMNNFDNGVHLLLGDSWFEIEGIYERFQEKFPHATFINFGVGGNELDNMIRRFTGTATDADIKNDPATYGDRKDATTIPVIDYVWVMSGTNEAAHGVTNDTYKANMDTLLNAIIDRGAKPLIFNASVGDVSSGTSFTLSRQYADLYYNQQTNLGLENGTFTPMIAGSTTAGSHTYDVQEGIYRKVGNLVFFTLRVRMSVKDSAMAGTVRITGLPFNPTHITGVTLSRADYVTYGTGLQLVAQIETAGYISINKIQNNGGALSVAAADVANNTLFYISGVYQVA